MSFKKCVLEGFGLDFGAPGRRFWRVRGRFFRDFLKFLACFFEVLPPDTHVLGATGFERSWTYQCTAFLQDAAVPALRSQSARPLGEGVLDLVGRAVRPVDVV